MRILVTGGSGMIGSRVIRKLVELDHVVAGIDNLSAGWQGEITKKARLFNADIRSTENIQQIFNIFAPEVTVHLAAVHHIPTCEKVRKYALDVNILGTENILNSIRENKCKKIIIASSGAVYDWKDGLLDENDKTKPSDNYSISKFTNECQLSIFSNLNPTIECSALRIFNTIANDDPNAHLIPDILNQLIPNKRNQEICLGNISTIRDYSHAEDIANAIVKVATTNKIVKPIYNVCSSKGNSAEDITNLISKIFDIEIKINIDSKRIRKIDRPTQVGKNILLRTDFPDLEFRNLEDSLREILSFYKF